MQATAKIFINGNSQAIRLPKAYRVDVDEMWISKNDKTGCITLKPKESNQRERNLKHLFQLIEENPFSEDFIPPREDAEHPDPFADTDQPQPKRRRTGIKTKQ